MYRLTSEFPEVNREWLQNGNGSMFLRESGSHSVDIVSEHRPEYQAPCAECERQLAESNSEVGRLRMEIERWKQEVDRERAERLRLLDIVEVLTKRN